MKYLVLVLFVVSAWAQTKPATTTTPNTQYFFSYVAEINGTHGSLFDSTGWTCTPDKKALVWKVRSDCTAVYLMLDGSSVVFDSKCYNPDDAAKAFWAAVQANISK